MKWGFSLAWEPRKNSSLPRMLLKSRLRLKPLLNHRSPLKTLHIIWWWLMWVSLCVWSKILQWHLLQWLVLINNNRLTESLSLTSCFSTAILSRGFSRHGKRMIKYSKELWNKDLMLFLLTASSIWGSLSVVLLCSGLKVVWEEDTWDIWPGLPTQWSTTWRRAQFTHRLAVSSQVCVCRKKEIVIHWLKIFFLMLLFLHVELPEDYRGRWETFVDQTLSEANRRNTIDLVNLHTCLSSVFNCCL